MTILGSGLDTSFLTCFCSGTATTDLHFVVSTDAEKQTPELRKLIRSHCMLGKNRGKTLPQRKGKSRTTTAASRQLLPATVPRKFGSDLSPVPFADAVEPSVVEVVLHCGLCQMSLSAQRLTI